MTATTAIVNDAGALVATITPSRLRIANAGYYLRLYTSPDEYGIVHTESIVAAKRMAREHAARYAS